MPVFLGAIKKELVMRYTSFDEVKKWKTAKLQKIEDNIYNYYYDRVQKKSSYLIFDSRAFVKLRSAWEKEVEKILEKNGLQPNYNLWAYNIGDVLA